MRQWSDYRRETAQLSSGVVNYRSAGSGRPIVFLHGAGGLRHSPAASVLSEQAQILQPALPGFDGSAYIAGIESLRALAGIVAGFIAAATADGIADVVGHSFGGRLAAWLALDYPRCVRRLVLECPAGFGLKEPPSKDPAILRRQLYVRADEAPPEDKPEEVVRGNRAALERYGLVARDEPLIARLPEISMPTLILFGTEERMIAPEAAQLLKNTIPDATLVYITEAAHNMDVDQPEQTAAAIGRFLGMEMTASS
ncbi:MAG: alpha/beta fold hydrolase [Alphaproteobacteria bacterium]